MATSKQSIKSIAVIGNHLPRLCGIATFTTDLCDALAAEIQRPESIITLAMDDVPEGYDYPERVKFEVRDSVQVDYLRAADFLNFNKPDIAILQHEYGIYGGKSGAHVFHLIENLHMPIITTLHTVLADPDADRRTVMIRLGEISECLLVMAQKAKDLLMDVYGMPEERIILVPHGIPDVPFIDSSFYKDKFGVENRKVILTFGLLGPDKGVEHMIDAMPDIVDKNPDAVYIVLGATHPHVIRDSGEAYRHGLQQRADNLGVKKYVLFFNQFLDLSTLTQFLTAADVYVTPYLDKEQIVSGTLSYAMGIGKATVSTPYWYAEEMLSNNRGILVPFNDHHALSESINHLLSSESVRNAMRKQAYQFTRHMVWKEVAQRHLEIGQHVLERRARQPLYYALDSKPKRLEALPEINLNHLQIMSDDTGVLQHARFSIPSREDGYCLDDNTRALIVASRYYKLRNDDTILPALKCYLAFVANAYNSKNSRFRNFMSYDRQWMEESGSEDSHGRALWGLGTAIQTAPDLAVRNLSCHLFVSAIGAVSDFKSIRAWAFSLIGIHNYLNIYGGDADVRKIRLALAGNLYRRFNENSDQDWLWPEDSLTYANGFLPSALILTGNDLKDGVMLQTGLDSLSWLLKQETHEAGHISVIGNKGWMPRNGERARFDQQPEEVMALVEACAEAFRVTSDNDWLMESRRCFDWFMGKNDLNIPVFDFKTGGCYDSLHPNGVNENMGAESTLAWLIALLNMYEIFAQDVFLKTKQKKNNTT